jgi:hypothetical protein
LNLRVFFLSALLLAAWSPALWAEGELNVRITPQVLEADHSVAWEQPLSRLTRSGLPVVVNIDAEGLAIRVSVTPFVREEGYLLVVQGEVRQKSKGGLRGSTSLQSLLVPAGETIAYFPLGRSLEEVRQMVVFIQVEAAGE